MECESGARSSIAPKTPPVFVFDRTDLDQCQFYAVLVVISSCSALVVVIAAMS